MLIEYVCNAHPTPQIYTPHVVNSTYEAAFFAIIQIYVEVHNLKDMFRELESKDGVYNYNILEKE